MPRTLGISGSVAAQESNEAPAWATLRPLLGDRTELIVVLVFASIGAGLTEAGVLALLAAVANAMVGHRDNLSSNLGPLALRGSVGLALAVALGLVVVRLSLQLVNAVIPAEIATNVQTRLRTDLFDAYTRASWATQAEESEGHFQELMTNQVSQTTSIVIQVVSAISGGLMFVALVCVAVSLNALVALTVLATAILLFWVLRPITRIGVRAGRDLSRTGIDQAEGVSEAVRLAEDAHVFGAHDGQRRVVHGLIEQTGRALFRFVLCGGLVVSVYQSLVMLLILGGLAGLYFAGAGNIAALGAVVLMLVRASSYAQQAQAGYQSFKQVSPYVDRLQTTMTAYRASTPRPGLRPLSRVDRLTFRNVKFSYGRGQEVLRKVSFEVLAGEAIGIVGASGAGKSTLAQLLLQLREPVSGDYLVNGQPAATIRREDWQRRVAYVSQEPRIMRASVADNIRFFRDLDGAAVVRAARLANIDEEIERLPAGYETVIGHRADAVSGGQKQRICLARALAAEPDVVVLDEPTSALDMASESAVQASLAELQGNVTLFVIAHRISTLSRCDRVMVLEAGVIKDFAPLVQLERTSAYYRATAALARGSL
jgi:ABC-type multidrug transport system fused ATPase/permease subunit